MTRLLAASLAAFLALTSLASAQDNPIIRILTAYTEAYNAGDAAAVASFYAEDAALFLPNQQMYLGRQAIEETFATAFAQGASNMTFNVIDIRAYGGAAVYEISEVAFDLAGQRVTGRHMNIWEQQGERIMLLRGFFHVLSVQ